MHRIKSVKDLEKLPTGNFLDTKTRIVYAKKSIEEKYKDELSKPKAKAKNKKGKK